jgi:hypothetical protein
MERSMPNWGINLDLLGTHWKEKVLSHGVHHVATSRHYSRTGSTLTECREEGT